MDDALDHAGGDERAEVGREGDRFLGADQAAGGGDAALAGLSRGHEGEGGASAFDENLQAR